MLKDDFYSYNNKYIIKYIEILLKNKEVGMLINEDILK